MTPFDRALGIVTEYEAAGETSAARMLLFTRIEDLCEVAEAGRRLVDRLAAAWDILAGNSAEAAMTKIFLPLRVIEHTESFAIEDAAGTSIAYVYYDDGDAVRRAVRKRLTKEQARQVAERIRALGDKNGPA